MCVTSVRPHCEHGEEERRRVVVSGTGEGQEHGEY